MPPKRKVAEEGTKETVRTTRASTRNKTNVAEKGAAGNTTRKSTAKAAASKNQAEETTDSTDQPPKKKAKTTRGGGKGKKAVTSTASKKTADESVVDDDKPEVKQSKSSSITHIEPHPTDYKPPEATTIAPTLDKPYTSHRALALFDSYSDPDEPNVIGPEGFEKLCVDAKFSMEGAVPLLLAWQMGAAEMAKISKDEWVRGTNELRISSCHQLSIALTELEDLLVIGKPPIKKPKNDPYDRSKYWAYASDSKGAFHKFYFFCFTLVKPPTSKNIEMDTALAFWTVLLGPKYPVIKDVVEFISSKEGTYRAANKDLWNMMLEFCETVNPNLDNFEADGAWPTLLDEFASWKMSK